MRSEVHLPASVTTAAKILIAGAFGVGKTTLVASVSEITPLRTEERMTSASVGVDDLRGVEDKTHTTVAMDFGRLTLNDDLVLYLFGAPGQRRFWDLWEGLAHGAVGCLLLVDTRRLDASFTVLDQLETSHHQLPLVVAVNRFPDTANHPPSKVRTALDLPAGVPVIECDARDRYSSMTALITLTQHALAPGTRPLFR